MDTILVVDDETNYLTVMEALLGEAGYEVLTAPSAIEALKVAGAADLDLVLTAMDFDSQERDGKPWHQRFPANALGGPEWEGATNPGSLLESLERLRDKAPAPRPRPTLFVSHRRDDVDAGLEVREVAHEEGFDAWLDVLAPLLATPPGQASSLWIACVIEMALLNSTHLVAVMSKKTNGSQWVPYEFGRVKARLLVAANASSWLVDDMLRGQLPEYLLLCPLHPTLDHVRLWLRANLAHYRWRQPAIRWPRWLSNLRAGVQSR